MDDAIPVVTLGLGAESQYVVILDEGGDREATDIATLLAMAPGLVQPAAALEAALSINHIAQGSAFEVIVDPNAYAEAYHARVATEDPNASWSQDKVRLSDYGLPDFEEIHAPSISGTVLSFFAKDSYLGVPYRVKVDLANPKVKVDDDSYEALDLTPVPGAVVPTGPGGSGIVDEEEDD